MSVGVMERILNIEYSRLPGAPGNTELHFRMAAAAGFDGLKADMRLTKDGEIVLCHDAGYTFDRDHRITEFDADSHTAIHDLTLKEILELEFDTPAENGDPIHPCTLDTMLSVCKENRLIPYLTNRHEEWREETAERMAFLLRRYGLENGCIMNLYPGDPRTMKAIRRVLPDPVACDTKHDYDLFSEQMIEDSAAQGYRIICLCHRSTAPVTKELVSFTFRKGIRIWEWGMTEPEEVKNYLDLGIGGFQMYTRKVTNSVIREMGY